MNTLIPKEIEIYSPVLQRKVKLTTSVDYCSKLCGVTGERQAVLSSITTEGTIQVPREKLEATDGDLGNGLLVTFNSYDTVDIVTATIIYTQKILPPDILEYYPQVELIAIQNAQ